jgi:hypothetical protein
VECSASAVGSRTKNQTKLVRICKVSGDLRGEAGCKLHDVHALDMLIPEPGAIYVMDRGYIDFARLHALHQAGAFFVTRAKSNLNAHRVYSAATDRTTGVIADQTIALDGSRTSQDAIFNEFDDGKRMALLTQLHETMNEQAVMIWVAHDLNPRALSPKLTGFVQAQSWFQDLTPIVVSP